MRTFKLAILIGLVIFSGLSSLTVTPHLAYADSTTVQVDPSETNVLVGDTFTINVTSKPGVTLLNST